MFRCLLLASVVALALAAEDAAPKNIEEAAETAAKYVEVAADDNIKAEESAYPLHPILEERDRARERGHDHDHLPGTGVYRELHHTGHPLPHRRIEAQDKIVYDVYSPNYKQPTWVLDYRYIKSGGRDYVRSESGKILILPKGMKAPPEYKERGSYDELIEFLRLQELAEREKLRLERNREHRHEYNAHEHHGGERVGWERELEREHRHHDRYSHEHSRAHWEH